MKRENKLIGVDLFSGAGGMSLGATLAGVNVRLAVEKDPSAYSTFVANHPDTKALNVSIEEVDRLPDMLDPKRMIIFGGPPCQGFSTSNQKTRSKENQGNWLFRSFISVVERHRPAWVVFENVRGFVELEKGHFAKRVTNELAELGYGTESAILNAVDFGVPQIRARFFLVGRLNGTPPKLPQSANIERVTVRDAIADLPPLELGANTSNLAYLSVARSEFAKAMRGNLASSSNHIVTRNADIVARRYPFIPQGGNWKDIPLDLMTNYQDRTRCHTGIYRRLKWHAPSVVIGNFRKNMLVHPEQHRGLSVREAARLQAFPDNYVFHGSIGFQQQQVGNAVPPLLAKAVFETILQAD